MKLAAAAQCLIGYLLNPFDTANIKENNISGKEMSKILILATTIACEVLF